jgi:hypothetical protein
VLSSLRIGDSRLGNVLGEQVGPITEAVVACSESRTDDSHFSKAQREQRVRHG